MATPATKGLVLSVFFGAGTLLAVLVGASVAVSWVRWELWGLGAAAVVVGGVATWRRARLPAVLPHLLAGAGCVLASAAVTIVPDPQSALALAGVFVFLAVDVFVVMSRLAAMVHLSLYLVCAPAVLMARGDVATVPAVAVALVMVAVAVVVAVLSHHASSASVDLLTGLPNRQGFEELVEQAVRAHERDGRTVTLALLDLDGFKAVNDTHGHAAGDEHLRVSAQRWRDQLPAHLVLARVGGDEFGVLAVDVRATTLTGYLTPLVQDVGCPVSAGVAQVGVLTTQAELMHHADAALYRAKRGGRGQVVIHDADSAGFSTSILSTTPRVLEGLGAVDGGCAALAADLDTALRRGQLHLHYQPLFRADALTDVADPAAFSGGDTNVPIAVEALARWDHPSRGSVSPAVFVAVAEEHGLIGHLGRYVLERACREVAALPARSRPQVGVNVSGLELVAPGYVDGVAAVLEATGLPAGELVLEVTESVVDADAPLALAALHAVRRLGVRIAVDDFGTGFSSLSRLDDVPADYLKLDCSFTATAHTSSRRARLVEGVTALATSLGIGVVAEGVESAEQARVLTTLGCEVLQGFHLGRPRPTPLPAEMTDQRDCCTSLR